MKLKPMPQVFSGIETVNPKDTDLLKAFRAKIVASEDSYPGIEAWFDRKVKPDLKTGRRVGFIMRDHEAIVGAALLKLGKDVKLCSLRFDVEGKGLGQKFWDAVIEQAVKRGAKHLYFTMPEHLWEGRTFFKRQKGVEMIGYKPASEFRRNELKEIVCDP